jgi:simple sugar transport system ATP-binding protein
MLALDSIVKRYPPGVVAVDGVSLSLEAGSIHGVVGENGAGKSTLMKIAYGLEHPDAGVVQVGGRPLRLRGPRDAIAAGIGMVHQELLLINEYTVWENVMLGIEPVRSFDRLDAVAARARVAAAIAQFDLGLDPDAPAEALSLAARQKIEILKLLVRDVRVLILDEPTAVLTPQEIPPLFAELRRLRDSGRAIVFISHHLHEVLDLCDTISVLRRGRLVASQPAMTFSRTSLAQAMVGQALTDSLPRTAQPAGPCQVSLQPIAAHSHEPTYAMSLLTIPQIDLHAGEIIGIAGVEGNGQQALIAALIGQGSEGFTVTSSQHPTVPATTLARRTWLAYVPQDRGRMGASLGASITDNTLMTHHRLSPHFWGGNGFTLNWQRARAHAQAVVNDYAVSTPGVAARVGTLSGGNQQKVILGRELTLDRPVLVLDQPTRGLDVLSTEFVHRQILAQRDAGKAILLISADLEELFRLADRIVVLYRSAFVADLPIAEATPDRVGRLMLSGHDTDTSLA